MDENLKAQIQQRMREKDTEDLLAIWTGADGEEWSAEAYEIARETLVERGVEPPEMEEDEVDQRDADEEADVYHDFNRLMDVAAWSKTLSWCFVGLAALLLIGTAGAAIEVLFGLQTTSLSMRMTIFVTLLGGAVFCAFFYVLSQALAQLIYLLLDIEENTRKPAQAIA